VVLYMGQHSEMEFCAKAQLSRLSIFFYAQRAKGNPRV
jgi:hypothetical protein